MAAERAEELVCYCVNGHRIVMKGMRVPTNCAICNGMMDLNRMFLHEPVSGASPEAAPPKPEETKPASTSDAQDQRKPDVRTPQPVKPAPVRQPPASVPVQHAPVPSADPQPRTQPPAAVQIPRPQTQPDPGRRPDVMRRPPVRINPQTGDALRTAPQPVPVPAGPERSPVTILEAPAVLDFFGESIVIPPEGGWLGRNQLGRELLSGNLTVSRKHVFVAPGQAGTLRVGPEQSMNGVFVDQGSGRRKLERGETVELRPGDILWLSNIPLKVVK